MDLLNQLNMMVYLVFSFKRSQPTYIYLKDLIVRFVNKKSNQLN